MNEAETASALRRADDDDDDERCVSSVHGGGQNAAASLSRQGWELGAKPFGNSGDEVVSLASESNQDRLIKVGSSVSMVTRNCSRAAAPHLHACTE
jgi:hypothetical protein